MKLVRWCFGLSVCLVAISGCGDSSKLPTPWAPSGPLRAPGDQLTRQELDDFLKIVASHPRKQVPEFSELDEDAGVSTGDTAAEFVQASQHRFRELYNPERQGQVWAEDRDWAKVLHRHHVAPSEFAAQVTRISCAVTRARLEKRTDLAELSKIAREEIQRSSAELREIDARRQPAREKVAARTQTLMRLGKTAAMLEFVDLLRQVPPENCALVKEYAEQLKPLLPGSQKDPFAELVEWQKRGGSPQNAPGDVIPAGHVQLRVGDNRIR